jgi:predicted metalloendopeptidase
MASLNELNSINSFIDWSSLLNNLTGIQYSTSQTPVQLDTPDYLGRLDTLLRNTSKEIIQDFFIVDFMLDQYRNLYAPVNPSNKTETSSKNEVKTARTPLSIVCADDTSRTFPDAIGRYFVLETFGGLKEKQRLEDLVSQIHDSWLKRIPSTPWLDKETAMQAYNKVWAPKIAYIYKSS